MANIELRPTQMHWLPNSDPYSDCCVHGGVYLKFDDFVVSDGTDNDWTVSTAAFNLLETIFRDRPMVGQEAIIPHCGFTMWPDDSEPDGLLIPNCDKGITWSITHDAGQVVHEFFKDRAKILTESTEWKATVCRFSDEVKDFMHTAWPKVIEDEMDRKGFELFMSLWQKRRANADNDENSGNS